jgi:hypothetical protein
MTITVEELFRTLSYGPLSNLALSNDGNGEIRDNKQAEILGYVNSGLLRLHSKFLVREQELILRLISGKTNYVIDRKFSQSGHKLGSLDPIYIMDILNPYQSDWIKALGVTDQRGCDLKLNDTENPCSIFTPRPSLVQVPRGLDGHSLSINYQAKHPTLVHKEDGSIDLSQEIDLPEAFHEPLLSFVASKVFSHMNTNESTMKSQEHYAQFNMLCNEIVDNDLVGSTISITNTNFERKGWV